PPHLAPRPFPTRRSSDLRGTQVVDEISELLGVELVPSDRVVEIGCGVGRLTRELAGRTTHVDALDVSEEMLDLAREYNPELANVDRKSTRLNSSHSQISY